MLLFESENISWWSSWNLATILNIYLWWILLVLNLIYGYTFMRIFRIINLCTQLAVTTISHKIMNNCCHLWFWRPYLISKTCFLRFYYFLQKNYYNAPFFFARKFTDSILFQFNEICYKMRYWGPFWISIINFPQGCKNGTHRILIMYTLKNMKHQ